MTLVIWAVELPFAHQTTVQMSCFKINNFCRWHRGERYNSVEMCLEGTELQWTLVSIRQISRLRCRRYVRYYGNCIPPLQQSTRRDGRLLAAGAKPDTTGKLRRRRHMQMYDGWFAGTCTSENYENSRTGNFVCFHAGTNQHDWIVMNLAAWLVSYL